MADNNNNHLDADDFLSEQIDPETGEKQYILHVNERAKKNLEELTPEERALLFEQVRQTFERVQDKIRSTILAPGVLDRLKEFSEFAARWSERQTEFFNSEDWTRLQAAFPDITEDEGRAILFTGLYQPVLSLLPELKEEIAGYEKETGKSLSFAALLETPAYTQEELEEERKRIEEAEAAGQDPDLLPDTLLELLLQQALDKHNAKALPEKLQPGKIDHLKKPLDKMNMVFWELLDTGIMPGQLSLPIEVKLERNGDDKPVTGLLSIYQDQNDPANSEPGILNSLTPYQRRVHDALYTAQREKGTESIVTYSELYYLMGGTSAYNQEQIDKIDKAVRGLFTWSVEINNREEAVRYGKPEFAAGITHILPARIGLKVKTGNGKVTEGAVQFDREMPLGKYASEHKQITAVPLEALQIPKLNMTDDNIRLIDYLLGRIAHIKDKKKNPDQEPDTILIDTLYKRAHITTSKQRSRAPDKIEKCLKHWKACGHISNYKYIKNGIRIYP